MSDMPIRVTRECPALVSFFWFSVGLFKLGTSQDTCEWQLGYSPAAHCPRSLEDQYFCDQIIAQSLINRLDDPRILGFLIGTLFDFVDPFSRFF